MTAAAAPELPTIPSSVVQLKDIEYGRVGSRSLYLDLYQPAKASPKPQPAIVRIHGGGWKTGDKGDRGPAEAGIALAERGFVVISVNYRMVDEAIFPAAVHDVKCATRWLRANAQKYQVDPERVGATGSSAGGHLSLMLGLSSHVPELEGNGGHANFSSHVSAVCSWCGPTNMMIENPPTSGVQPAARIDFLGGTPQEKPENYENASPIFHATKNAPPILFFHGDRDPTVPFSQSESLYQKLKSLGASVELVTVKNAGHSFEKVLADGKPIEPPFDEIKKRTYDFFIKHLKP
jgi:acetyl esterase/lipase